MSNRHSAEIRDREIDQALGTETPALDTLIDTLWDSYSSDTWGLIQFTGIEDKEQRAVASDLVLSAVEGVEVNLHQMALCEMDLKELCGPNGRTMPGPETTLEDLIADKRLNRASTDFARAFGSTLDCLAAVTIGILALPASIQGAAGARLLVFPELSTRAPQSQHAAREDAVALFNTHAERDPAGWLAWTLELRDAVVHRGHLTSARLPVPAKGPRKLAVLVRSKLDMARLLRYEPHLRGKPWQPDMLSLSGPGTPSDALIWLPEPAVDTVAEIKLRSVALVEEMAALLNELLTADRTDWILPEETWRLERVIGKPRTTAAVQFKGFNLDYPNPPLSGIVVHPRSAQRLELAEQLRQTANEQDET